MTVLRIDSVSREGDYLAVAFTGSLRRGTLQDSSSNLLMRFKLADVRSADISSLLSTEAMILLALRQWLIADPTESDPNAHLVGNKYGIDASSLKRVS